MTRALPPTETSRALLSHTLARLPIKLWPHFFTRTSTSSVHQLNHPTRNQPSKLPRTFINRLQNASCQRQEPCSPVPAILPERLQEPHPSLEDWPSQPYPHDSLPHSSLGYPRRLLLRCRSQGPWLQLLLRKLSSGNRMVGDTTCL